MRMTPVGLVTTDKFLILSSRTEILPCSCANAEGAIALLSKCFGEGYGWALVLLLHLSGCGD